MCASGCPERLRQLLFSWGWMADGCGAYVFEKGSTAINNALIEEDPTAGLRLAILEEMKGGRTRWDIVRDVMPALMEGLDASVKQGGILAAAKSVGEMLHKLIEGPQKSMKELVEATVNADELWVIAEERTLPTEERF